MFHTNTAVITHLQDTVPEITQNSELSQRLLCRCYCEGKVSSVTDRIKNCDMHVLSDMHVSNCANILDGSSWCYEIDTTFHNTTDTVELNSFQAPC